MTSLATPPAEKQQQTAGKITQCSTKPTPKPNSGKLNKTKTKEGKPKAGKELGPSYATRVSEAGRRSVPGLPGKKLGKQTTTSTRTTNTRHVLLNCTLT